MIKDDKIRILITMTKEMKLELENLADKEIRTTSNFIVSILKDYIDKYNDAE